jgi:hypothetical protein
MTQNKGLVLVHSALVTLGIGLFSLQAHAQPVAEEQQPICFMETTSGQVVDLSRLCGQDRPVHSPVAKQTFRQAQRQHTKSSLATVQFEQNLKPGEAASGKGSV